MARVDKSDPSRLVKGYGKLDEQFVHPRFFDQLTVDDDARIDHDFYSYKTLLFWIFTKADPFGTGTVIDHPEADRRWRMKEDVYCIDFEIEARNKVFVERGINRLGDMQVQTYIFATDTSDDLRKYPTVIMEAFKEVFKCDNVILKKGSGKAKKCNFARLTKEMICPYCSDSKRLKAIAHKEEAIA